MTKQGKTEIVVVLDRSGSMETVRRDTIGGFNSFVDAQRQIPGEALLSMYQFDTEYEAVHEGRSIHADVKLSDGTFVPRGGTALYDAVGRTIDNTGARLARMAEHERPEKVLFVIVTDGEENSSRTYNLQRVREMIDHQRAKYSWEFVFIGASMSAFQQGAAFGLSPSNTLRYAANARGTAAAFDSLTVATSNYRTSHTAGKTFAAFTPDDQAAQDAAKGNAA